jgi:hypothetical protein
MNSRTQSASRHVVRSDNLHLGGDAGYEIEHGEVSFTVHTWYHIQVIPEHPKIEHLLEYNHHYRGLQVSISACACEGKALKRLAPLGFFASAVHTPCSLNQALGIMNADTATKQVSRTQNKIRRAGHAI